MKFLSSSALAVALLAGHGLANCHVGAANGSNSFLDLDIISACSLGPNSVYSCGHGTKVQHKFNYVHLAAGTQDSTIAVACSSGPHDVQIYWCSKYDATDFELPSNCGNILSVNVVVEH
ncbi:hypothetical protein E4U43_006320 [Claviceps pusilla]|uniref:Uncharacterized protein n=1 Tax=Claviceps pusilla TaxID=123648 RepID=A0A9P7T2C3_9HYPO|nr:hypothetical protein E4U43_006320 [Claviceps pusilla]